MGVSKARKRTLAATRARKQNVEERETERRLEAAREAADPDFLVFDGEGSETESEAESEEGSDSEWGTCCEKHQRVDCEDEQCSLGDGEWRGWVAPSPLFRQKLEALQQLAHDASVFDRLRAGMAVGMHVCGCRIESYS